MKVLLETADFGANEVIRMLYLLDATPEHLLDAAVQWRGDDALERDPNLPEAFSAAIRDSFTSFKYWFDDPFRCDEFTGDTEKFRESSALNGHEDMAHGQDMTYWSENHRILFATAEYLAGQFWPDEQFVSMRAYRKEGPGGPLRKGDKTGREHMAHARTRVLRWLDERLRIGFSEWNSPGYYVYDIIPLLNLADFAVDREVRTRAAMVMDLLAFDLAVNAPTGAMAGSAGRVYFEGKNCVWEQAVRNPSELLFGRLKHFSESTFAAGAIATSPSYRPPDVLIQLARKGPSKLTAKSRVSITFDEARDYGVGVSTADDMEFWWSRAAYATKQTIRGSRAVATEYGLLDTGLSVPSPRSAQGLAVHRDGLPRRRLGRSRGCSVRRASHVRPGQTPVRRPLAGSGGSSTHSVRSRPRSPDAGVRRGPQGRAGAGRRPTRRSLTGTGSRPGPRMPRSPAPPRARAAPRVIRGDRVLPRTTPAAPSPTTNSPPGAAGPARDATMSYRRAWTSPSIT